MVERKWSQHVHVKHGGLDGWCEHCSARSRHAALRRVAERDGAGEVSKRLNFLANVADRRDNQQLHRVARADQRWVKRNLERGSRSRRSPMRE